MSRTSSGGESESFCGEIELPLPFPPIDADKIESDPRDAGERKELESKSTIVENSMSTDLDDDALESSIRETMHLGRLPSDVFVLVCCSLSVRDIASLAMCSKGLYAASRNQDLWREKFQARWNYDDPTIVNWASAYRQAYSNPHDLWITHWNCVEPCDGLGPGRCCVQEEEGHHQKKLLKSIADKAKAKHGTSFRRKHLCPSCRYHPCLEIESTSDLSSDSNCSRTPISTPAQAIHTVTSLRLGETSDLLPCKPYSPKIAEHAFQKASTFHRSIDHRQYKAESLFFLEDLLFFHVHDIAETDIGEDSFELRDWKRYAEKTAKQNDNGSEQGHDPLTDSESSEPALHSWHLVNVCNPDYSRPMVWRILVQRSDCFTVFPSEGYLLPGESKLVTFGVKPFGSLVAHATNQLNIHRHGVDSFWKDLYMREAHLPSTPFLFQYHYAPNVACHTLDNTCLSNSRQQQQANPISLQQSQLSMSQQALSRHSPWRQCFPNQKQSVRSISLAGHVHANYSLSEFRRKTLVPYTLPSHHMSRTEKFIRRYIPREQHLSYSMSPVVFCSPQLMEFHPLKWQRLQALRLEEQRNKSVFASKYRTEKACHECGLTWGPRMEELGQAFVLAKLEMESIHQRQRRRILSIYRTLTCLVDQQRKHQFEPTLREKNTSLVRKQQIIERLRKKVMNYRGIPWLSSEESRVFLQWELLLDLLYRKTTIHQHNNEAQKENSLRQCGVYRYPTSTGSVFDRGCSFDHTTSSMLSRFNTIILRDEPKDMQDFSHLASTPGKFCFRREHDNQNDTETTKRVNDITTDIFMDDKICGLKAAICVLGNSRSLLIHGIYDEVPYPGCISRRPKLPILLKLNEREYVKKIQNELQTSFDPFITSQQQLAYYELQESLDIQGLLIMNSFYNHVATNFISLRYFIQNTPAPGSGRFAISRNEHDVHKNHNFWFLEEKCHGRVTECVFDENLHELRPSNSQKQDETRAPSQDTSPPGDGLVDVPQVPIAMNHAPARGPRLIHTLWFFSSQLGWNVDSNATTDSVYVDRRILIAAQCLALTTALLPIVTSLFARYFQLIPTVPTLYHLDGLPYETENKMRFLTQVECGCVGSFLLLLYCKLFRWIERYTNRNFFRVMVEHVPIREEYSWFRRFQFAILDLIERHWDTTCPLALQKVIYLPHWNRRSKTEFLRHLCCWRSQECNERQSTIRASVGKDGISEQKEKAKNAKKNNRVKKILAGIIMILLGFSASSPYFSLNFLSVAACSMSLGISVSLYSLETGRSKFATGSFGSVIESLSLVNAVILGLLVGQLIGGSGGVLFLVEFAVTAISLVLGGMGTISASGMKSWGTFFCLSLVSFWGCFFGRCTVIESIKKKRSSISSMILCTSLFSAISLLFLSIVGWRWETLAELMVEKPTVGLGIAHAARQCTTKELA